MGDRESHQPLQAIARAGTGLANIAPARSRTDPPEPTPRPEKTHLHKRLHSNTITGRVVHGAHHHRHRDKAKDTVQSAIDLKPPISFDHLLRREKKSPGSSRRGSGGPTHQQRYVAEWRAQQQIQAERDARRRVKPEDVEKAKRENEKREEELRSSLKQVEELGMWSTRQLDDTYYGILEKASLLRSTVASLRQLVEESRRMHKHFAEDSRKLEQDTSKTIDSFGNFEHQGKNINQLIEKLKASKADTEKLNERLEHARMRVEEFERREKEKQATRRKQWHATWGTLVGILVLIVALVVLRHRRHLVEGIDGAGQAMAKVDKVAQEAISLMPTILRPRPSPSEDPYLRQMFDTL